MFEHRFVSRIEGLDRREAATSGKLITKIGPIWLKVSADGTRWLVDRTKAKIVQKLFELSVAGYGAPTIARMFNEQRRPTLTDEEGARTD